jgi:hypothetical protein
MLNTGVYERLKVIIQDADDLIDRMIRARRIKRMVWVPGFLLKKTYAKETSGHCLTSGARKSKASMPSFIRYAVWKARKHWHNRYP